MTSKTICFLLKQMKIPFVCVTAIIGRQICVVLSDRDCYALLFFFPDTSKIAGEGRIEIRTINVEA